jgi:Mor family transcriptional regulator
MSTQKRKRQTISVETKKEIIDAHSKGKSYGELATQFKISSRSTIQDIIRNKYNILAAIDDGMGGKQQDLNRKNMKI